MAARGGVRKATRSEYLGTQEVAALLDVSTRRVRQLAAEGTLPEAMNVGGRRVYRRADVDRFVRLRARNER
jgi:excisionase family DNA binding protein